jgi:hypothetical protein
MALLLGAAILKRDGGAGFPTAKPRSNAQWAHLYAALPLSFEANRGQTDPRVSFLSRGQGYTVFLTGREAVLTLKSSVAGKAPSSAVGGRLPLMTKAGLPVPDNQQPAPEAVLRMKLVGSNPSAQVAGAEELPGKANYFIGNDPSKWHTDVPTYAKVRYESVYPGVDLVYYGTQGGELEYDFVVAPGADPHALALDVAAGLPRHDDGVKSPLQINSDGDLVISLSTGDVKFHKPMVYQTSVNHQSPITHRQSVESHYALDAQNHVRFELGPYDHHRPLVIDPVLLYSTYIGGGGGDIANAIQVDNLFNAYIAGVTNSTNFPTGGPPGSPPSYQSINKGNGDCFVTEMNPDGTKLVFSTYLGGTGSDTATAMVLSNGSPTLTGYTTSLDFPTKAPVTNAVPFQQNNAGGTDAFVTQLNTTGNALVYSTYLGGSGDDFGLAIAVDTQGNAYVAGSTLSTDFPVTAVSPATPFQPHNAGSQDGFVTKVNFNGEALVYSNYLGGSGADVAQGIQVDSHGNAYVTGYTFSSNFPTVNPLQPALAGGADAFVAEVNPTGSALTFSTFLGGTGDDRAAGIALDGSNNIYIVGTTGSTDFPTSSPVFQPSLVGSSDAFVTKLNNAGSQLVYSTYLGGTGVTQGTAIAVTPTSGIAYVTGFTESSNFPTANPIQPTLGLSSNTFCEGAPCADVFVTEFTSNATGLTYSTYLGGNGPDFGEAIALDSTGDPYITGSTSSTNFPAASQPVPGTTYVPPFSSALNGTSGNAFIAKIDSGAGPNISIVPDSVNFGNETISVTSPLQAITIFNPSTSALVITNVQAAEVGTSTTVFTVPTTCVGTINPGSFCTMYVAFTPNTTGAVTDQITITDNVLGSSGVEQTITLNGTGVTAATAVTVQPNSLSFNSQTVGTSSQPQTVTITNTGSETLNISNFSTGSSNNFQYTSPGCLAVNNTLSPGQSCTASVTFTPTGTGSLAADLAITDNATGSPQEVSLTGIGAAEFSIVQPSAQTPTLVGSTQAVFKLQAQGNSNFTGAITLACSSGNTCVFNPTTVFVGGNTTMTISNLSPNPTSNPYIFQVTGTSGSQTTSLQVNLQFEDFTLTASPSVDTVQAGATANYTILVNPLFGFNQQVQLLCYQNTPPDSTCNFNPTSGEVTPNGSSPASVALGITTVKYVPTPTHAPPRFPGGRIPPLIFGLLCLAGLASLAFGNRRRGRIGWLGTGWLGVRLATLSMILVLNLALAASCRPSTLVITGTTTGSYSVVITGTLVSNNAVVRTTTLALAVTASPGQ